MLSEIKECLIRDGYTSEEDINSRVISKIITSGQSGAPISEDRAVRFEWRNTLLYADTDDNHIKAYEEEMYCLELSRWCFDHGMLFKCDVGCVEGVGYRGFDHVLIMPGAEYMRLLSESREIPKTLNR